MLLIDTYLILALAILFFVKIKLRQLTSLLLLLLLFLLLLLLLSSSSSSLLLY